VTFQTDSRFFLGVKAFPLNPSLSALDGLQYVSMGGPSGRERPTSGLPEPGARAS